MVVIMGGIKRLHREAQPGDPIQEQRDSKSQDKDNQDHDQVLESVGQLCPGCKAEKPPPQAFPCTSTLSIGQICVGPVLSSSLQR